MSAICGIANFQSEIHIPAFQKSQQALKARFTKPTAVLEKKHLALACSEGIESHVYQGKTYTVGFFGRLRNESKLRLELQKTYPEAQHVTLPHLILLAYLAYQEACADHMDGAFIIALCVDQRLILIRDALGVNSLYYKLDQGTLYFASELKGLLVHEQQHRVDKTGLWMLLGILPALVPGQTPYHGFFSLRPGHYLIYEDQKVKTERWWHMTTQLNTKPKEMIKQELHQMITESILADMPEDKTSCFLSGGLDSSLIAAVCQNHSQQPIVTYSVDYEDQARYFHSYSYQTTRDNDYIQEMCEQYPFQHRLMTIKQKALIETLETVMKARDLPGMVDIDSSLYLFSQRISQDTHCILSGECADEIFGGYPWFYKETLYTSDYFPWTTQVADRLALFKDETTRQEVERYMQECKQRSLDEINQLDSDPENARKQQMMYLTMEWFMQTLLVRGDVLGGLCDLEIRMPFANKAIAEYVWNVPWHILYANQEEKGLLREIFEDILPASVAHRKKNPYPKTHSPVYTELACAKLKSVLADPHCRLQEIFDMQAIQQLLDSQGASFKSPWYGQLMTGPQLISYLYTINQWLNEYHIILDD